MATGTLAPSPVFTGFDSNGDPLSGGLLYTYLAGTSTPSATYTDVGLSVANANPIVLNSAGRAVIFLTPGQSYKFVLQTSAGAAVYTVDNIAGGPAGSTSLDLSGTAGEALGAGKAVYLSDGSGALTAGRWYLADSANPYSSTLPVVGMTQASIGSGAVGSIRLNGSVTGLSSLTAGTTYYVGTLGALTSAAPINARMVGQADTITTLVMDASLVDERPVVVQTSTLTGTQNDFALTPGVKVLYLTGAATIQVSGFSAGYDGQRVLVMNRQAIAGFSSVSNQDTASVAANRLITMPNSLTVGALSYLAASAGWFEMVYDATAARWRMVAYDSGWITPTFVGGQFTGSGAMTWTVDSGDVTTSRFRVNGRTVTYVFNLATTTIAGTPTALLQISNQQYGGGVIAATAQNALAFANDGTVKPGYSRATAAAALIEVTTTSAAAWAAVVNGGYFAGEIIFEVT